MDEVLADIFDTCLDQLQAGASVEECLAAYPQHRAELELPLRTADRLHTLPHPVMPALTRAALETQVLARVTMRLNSQTAMPAVDSHALAPSWRTIGPSAALAGVLRALGYRGPLPQLWLRVTSVALALILALVVGTGALAAARAFINAVAPHPSAAPTASLPLAQTFTLDGPIEQIRSQEWVVAGITVDIDTQTTIDKTAATGVIVHIRGVILADGTLHAQHVTVALLPATPTVVPTQTVTATLPTASPAPPSPTPLPAQPPPAPLPIQPSPVSLPAQPPPPAPAPVQPPPVQQPGDSGDSGKPPKPPKPPKPKKSKK